MAQAPRAGVWLALLLPLSAALAAAGEETLLGCRSVADPGERLACYDRLVDRLTQATAPEASARASSSEATPTPPLHERLFGRSDTENAKALKEAYGAAPPREISAKIVSADRGGDRLYRVALDNGQVWRQAEPVALILRAGDTVEIQAGALGAYYLRRDGKGRSVRFQRLE